MPADAPSGTPSDPGTDPAAPLRNSLRALLDGTIRVETDDLAVSDAWIDPDAMAVRYVGLDVGGWLDRHVALVAASRLAWVDEGLGPGWRAAVTRAEIEGDEARLSDGGGLIDVAALPPVLTGPFGHTVSPALIRAGLMAEAQEERTPLPPGEEEAGEDEDGAPRDEARALDRAADWLGLTVAARHDVIAQRADAGPRVEDLLLDPDDLRITHAVVEADGRGRAVPVAHLGARPRDDGALPLALTRAEIDALPEVVTLREAARDGLV